MLANTEATVGQAAVFWILAPLALAGGIGMVLARNAIHSALLLACTMMSLGVLYMLQEGVFIGFVQMIVYTGAIMMLFLFVIMLAGRDSTDSLVETLRGQRLAAIGLGVALAVLLGSGLARGLGAVTPAGLEEANAGGNVEGLAELLFTRYLFAFEVTAVLLMVAAVGALLLAHVEKPASERKTQKDFSRERFAEGNYPGPKAGPGVFATSDSVATPALLPDGTEAEGSLSRVVPMRQLEPSEIAPKRTEGKKGDRR
ncbi:MAG TPA: NADH-quinone oxidoreductase subunit J [Candidatus Stackebrandtia excrementipullorum]|nr:NADH-quinone oxidoreductase subunit J [Candidatus Stackebrandtia excrementipullorum]